MQKIILNNGWELKIEDVAKNPNNSKIYLEAVGIAYADVINSFGLTALLHKKGLVDMHVSGLGSGQIENNYIDSYAFDAKNRVLTIFVV